MLDPGSAAALDAVNRGANAGQELAAIWRAMLAAKLGERA